MLRKKLSKVILSGLVAAMAIGVSSTAGQAVVQAKEVQVISETTTTPETKPEQPNTPVTPGVVDVTAENIVEMIAKNEVTGINVKTPIQLNSDITNELATKLSKGKFTINVTDKGSLDIKSAAVLKGFGANGESALTIVRKSDKQDAVVNIDLNTKSRELSNVTIDGVTFLSESKTDQPMITVADLTSGKTVSILNNTIEGGALLQESKQGVTVTGTKLGTNGKEYVNNQVKQKITLNEIGVNGTTLTITGVADKNTDIEINITDSTKTTTVNTKTDEKGNFSITYNGVLNETYKVVAKTPTAASDEQRAYTNTAVKVDVTNITSSSATVGLTYGKDFDFTKYPSLTLTVNNNTYKLDKTNISASVTGLSSNTLYTYELTDGKTPATTLAKGSFTTSRSSSITGGDSSVVTTDISSSNINRATIKDVSIEIPVSNKSLVSSMEKGKDFKVDVKGVDVEFNNGKLTLKGLVPEKEYRNIILTYVDNNNRTRTVRIARFTTKTSETKVRQFVKDVYTYSLGRVADEEGFAYWEKQLTGKKTTPQNFVKNLLSEKEFINKYTTTEGKIEGLYQVIVNRKSDSEGLKFWVNRYNALVKQGFSQEIALSVVVDEMVNEQEFKNRVNDLGL